MKEKLEKRLQTYTQSFNSALTRFLSSNTRKDRDSVIKYKAKLDEVKDLISLCDN